MNNVVIIGRLTRDPEIRWSIGDMPVAFGNYALAVDRPTRKDSENITDFINCKVVGKPAEFAEKHLRKGMKIAITGRIQVDRYEDRDGNNRTSTYVQVSTHEFCESRSNGETTQAAGQVPSVSEDENGFINIPDGLDEELPF